MFKEVHKPEGVYLLSHSVGLRPKKNPTLDKYLKLWEQKGALAWPDWLHMVDQFNDHLAALLGGAGHEFCPQVNITSGLAKIISSLPVAHKNKNKILLTEHDFPSLAYCLQRAKEAGYELSFINKEDNICDTHVWHKYLAADVAVCLIHHVTSFSGQQTPIKQIAAFCRQKGITTILDIAHSAGVLPLDLNLLGADFALGSGVKWLCCGPGACFLWANSKTTQDFNPTDVGWFSHENPFEHDIYSFRPHSTAKKFFGATPNIAPIAQAVDSLAMLRSIGLDRIFLHNKNLRDKLILNLQDKGHQLLQSKSEFMGGTVIVRENKKIESLLLKNSALFDRGRDGFRISPHFYNTIEDIDLFLHQA